MPNYTCLRCNRPLKNPAAVAIGMGKICAAKVSAEREGEQTRSAFIFEEASNPDVVMRRANGVAMSNVIQRVKQHSPTGLEWGYGGSGPADMALNILLRFGLPQEKANALHQDFKWKFVAAVPSDGGVIRHTDIVAWIEEQERQVANG